MKFTGVCGLVDVRCSSDKIIMIIIVVTGAHDRTVKVWDMQTGNALKTIFCFSSTNDVALSESFSAVISAHLDGNQTSILGVILNQ